MRRIVIALILAAFAAVPAFASSLGLHGWFEEGLDHLEARRYDQAIDAFSRSIKINPKLAVAYNNRGIARRAKGQLQMAIDDYTKAVEIAPEFSDAYNNRGTAYFFRGQWALALADCAKALDLNPDLAWAHNQMAWILATCPDEKFRNGENALKYAKMALKYGNNDAMYDTLSAAYAEAGMFEKAVKSQEMLIAGLEKTGLDDEATEAKLTEYRTRLEMYKAGRAWRTGAKAVISRETAERKPEEKQKAAKRPPQDKPVKKIYSIQAGAFLSQDNAKGHASDLSSRGYEARVLDLPVSSGKVWHLVLIGEYSTKEEAKASAANLTARENIATAVHAYTAD